MTERVYPTKELDPDVVLRVAAEAPDGVVIVDREGVIRYWNRGAERIFGHPASAVTGSSLDVITPTVIFSLASTARWYW